MKKFSLLAAILFGIFPSYLINIAVRNAGRNPFRFRGRLRKSWKNIRAIVEVCAISGKRPTDPIQFPATVGDLEAFIKSKLINLASQKLAFERMDFKKNGDDTKAVFRKLFEAALPLDLLLYEKPKWYYDQAGELSRNFERDFRKSNPKDFPTPPKFYSLGHELHDGQDTSQDQGLIWVPQLVPKPVPRPAVFLRLETSEEMAERLRQQIIPQEAAFAAIESEPKKGEANQVADKH